LKVQRTDAVVALRLICLQCKAENVDHLDGLLLAQAASCPWTLGTARSK
jgi:hypothetical protein